MLLDTDEEIQNDDDMFHAQAGNIHGENNFGDEDEGQGVVQGGLHDVAQGQGVVHGGQHDVAQGGRGHGGGDCHNSDGDVDDHDDGNDSDGPVGRPRVIPLTGVNLAGLSGADRVRHLKAGRSKRANLKKKLLAIGSGQLSMDNLERHITHAIRDMASVQGNRHTCVVFYDTGRKQAGAKQLVFCGPNTDQVDKEVWDLLHTHISFLTGPQAAFRTVAIDALNTLAAGKPSTYLRKIDNTIKTLYDMVAAGLLEYNQWEQLCTQLCSMTEAQHPADVQHKVLAMVHKVKATHHANQATEGLKPKPSSKALPRAVTAAVTQSGGSAKQASQASSAGGFTATLSERLKKLIQKPDTQIMTLADKTTLPPQQTAEEQMQPSAADDVTATPSATTRQPVAGTNANMQMDVPSATGIPDGTAHHDDAMGLHTTAPSPARIDTHQQQPRAAPSLPSPNHVMAPHHPPPPPPPQQQQQPKLVFTEVQLNNLALTARKYIQDVSAP